MKLAHLLLFGLASVVNAGDGKGYNYKQNGADWPDAFPECGANMQSPIDLKTSSFPFFKSSTDNFQKIYTNQVGEIEVMWTGFTTQVAVNKPGQTLQTFQSMYSRRNLRASPRYTGVQFHFHAGSEHTVDGKRHDFEMHTVHIADDADKAVSSGVGYAAVGIMFSVEHFTKQLSPEQQHVVDVFFESLKWDQLVVDEEAVAKEKAAGDGGDAGDAAGDGGDGSGRRLAASSGGGDKLPPYYNPIVSEVPYGDLMNMVDTDSRWVYEGSVTTPPCAKTVYWNVVREIYPITQKHYDLYKHQLQRGDYDLYKTGNYRQIMPYDDHRAQVMITPEIDNYLIENILKQFYEMNKFYEQTALPYSRGNKINKRMIKKSMKAVPLYYNLLLRTVTDNVDKANYEAAYLGNKVQKNIKHTIESIEKFLDEISK